MTDDERPILTVVGGRGNNPRLSPRSTKCSICKDVADIADVNFRLWDDDGNRIPAGTWRVAEYLQGIGLGASERALEARAQSHRNHAEAYVDGKRVAVQPPKDGQVIIPPTTGPARWLDVQQDAMDLGRDALANLTQKLADGTLEPEQVVAIAKLGVSTAGKRADLEAKGKRLNQVDELMMLVAGMRAPKQLPSG